MGRKKNRNKPAPTKSSDMTYPYAFGGGDFGFAGTAGRNRDLIRTDAGSSLAYLLVGTVNRCVEIITNAVNNIPWEMVVGDGDNERVTAASTDRMPKHPFAAAMRGVYVEQSIPLRKLMSYSELIYGETYIEKCPVMILRPRSIKWLNPLWTEPQIAGGGIQFFRYTNPWGDFAIIDPLDMAYEHTFNPQNDLRGYSVVNAVLDEINIDRDLKRDLKAFFRNGSRPGFVISPKGDSRYNPQDIATIKEQVQNYLKGVDNAHSTLVSPISAVYEAFERADVDKQYKISDAIRTEIYMGFGVPPSLAGDSGGATYKDGEEVLEAFYFNTINPMAQRQAAFINAFLMPFFDPSGQTTFRVIVPEPRAVIANRTAQATLVDMQVKGGYLSYADGGRAMGLTPDPRLEELYNVGGKPLHIDTLSRDARSIEEIPGKFVFNSNGVAIPQGEVFQYHIETGAVDINEVRAGRGLPPKAAKQDDGLQQLQMQFNTMAAGVQAGLPPALVAQMVGLNLPPGVVPVAPVNPMMAPQLTSGLPVDQPEPQKGAASLCVMLSLANNPDLIDLQRRLKAMFPDPAIKWNDPSDFHITLLYAPAIEDDQIASVVEILDDADVKGLSLKIGSLACFDNVGEHALHFRIARNSAFLDAQASLFDACDAIGLQASGYSQPARYTPHVTMGYLPERIGRITFHGKVSVDPVGVICSVERGGENEIVYPLDDDTSDSALKAHSHHTHANPDYVFEKALSPAEWREKALKELINWQRLNKAGKARAFQPVYTRHLLDAFTSGPALEGPSIVESSHFFDYAFAAVRHDPFKTTLARLDTAFTLKDFTETRQAFEDEFLLAIADRKDGTITSSQLSAALNAVIDSLGPQSYIDGLEDGGVSNADLDDDDRESIGMLVSEAKGYIRDFVAKFETYSDIQLDGKPREWAAGTLQKFYQRGVAAADANGTYVWRRGPTEQGCEDCMRLDGTRARMKTWLKNGLLPQSQKLSCYGLNCLCALENVRGGAKG